MIKRAPLLLTVMLLLAAGRPPAHADGGPPIRAFSVKSFDEIRKANAGKAFVLAFWSIHCAPCIEDMSDWRALKQKYSSVPILLVTTDPPEQHAAAARMLEKYRPGPVETWGFADDFGERVRFAVDRTWRGELPRTYFFDAAHRAETVSGRVDVPRAQAWFARQAASQR
jgi:thiol-disulfide isomerase/thioredoxin